MINCVTIIFPFCNALSQYLFIFNLFLFYILRNLPYKITADELYDIFGKYGTVRQIRKGNSEGTRGTSFVVYDDIYDAKNALDHLSGFNVAGRYLVILYYDPVKVQKKKEKELQEKLKNENELS
ncbi:Drosophila melanogaster RE19804p-related [Plasmodium yoelii yoelii]|uniref:Drosophila melanogaster RE19804p-related n=2 Tax=Plasmodium yoelii yoelii TaxID=73239 RepID=Q7R8I3_PLAYO|nr:Drosophila melanogaster RE19804p-related [Plasmodium yoelii yoelii]WBY61027.1 splicing factor 3B subunit 6 [Plasmodium yoelii yoelii]